MTEYPQNCIQYMAPEDWWQEDSGKTLCRGALVETYVQFYSSIPLELVSERSEATQHNRAEVIARPLHADGRRSVASAVPVAGLPNLAGAHCYIVNRAKKRPCLVLGAIEQEEIHPRLTRGMSKWKSHLFFLVAPFFGVEQVARDGYNPEFVDRIMQADYRAFFWDQLPKAGGLGSILRLDQIQPVGFEYQAYKHWGYKLSPSAQCIMDEWLDWLIYNHDGKQIAEYRDFIKSIQP
ncbi:MAG: hypothetical protein PHP44_05590 [Kiritimatiellae bacterium]|nr:hypothetical protein [Kiritimatiellia bacterium]